MLVMILIFGYFGYSTLLSNYFPEVESKIITIQAVYPGASPEEIEKGIILKMEDNLKGMTGVERVSSVSSENLGTITVEVMKSYDTDLILTDVKNAIDRINNFPDGMDPPAIYKRENLGTAVSFAITGDKSLRELKSIAEDIENDIRGMDGVSKVEISGYPEEEIEIALKEDALRAYNLRPEIISAMVRQANLELTGGIIKGSDEELLIRAKTKEYYAQGLKDIVVKATPDGRILRLSDVAEVRDRWEDKPDRSFFNGNPSVVINVKNTIDEDILGIAETIKEYIYDFNEEYASQGVTASLVKDFSVTLQQRIDLLTENGQMGLILVLVFLALFLNYRLAWWVGLSIPVSFAGMFIIAAFWGITINVMSLFGMIIVIGILVDDGIVISESIYQEYEKGAPSLKAAITGTMNVLPAVFSAILTTVIAFSAFFLFGW